MKHINKHVFLLIASGLFAASAHAFDHSMSSQTAPESLKKLDCQVDAMECRYYAAVEVAAYFDACPAAFERKFGRPLTLEESTLIQGYLLAWPSLRPASMKDAVLSRDNKLRQFLAGKTLERLTSGTSADMGSECSRIGMVKDEQPPENMSELLKVTRK